LSDLLFPLCQFRLFTFVLWDWLWRGIKYWDWHASHRRKLGHSGQTVSKSAGRCSSGEFSDLHKMNLCTDTPGQLARQIDYPRCRVREIDWDENTLHVFREFT
jgi:hypothetical protein